MIDLIFPEEFCDSGDNLSMMFHCLGIRKHQVLKECKDPFGPLDVEMYAYDLYFLALLLWE